MITLEPIGQGIGCGLPFKAVREGAIYPVPGNTTLRIELEPGLYLVRAIRTDAVQLPDWGAVLQLTERSAPDPFAGVPRSVHAMTIIPPLIPQLWISADRQCALWIVGAGDDYPFPLDVLVWRYGDCPPEHGGEPEERRRRLPMNG